MAMYQSILSFKTKGREIINITSVIVETIKKANHSQGLCNLFIQHTSASLLICENADFVVLQDLERFMERLVPDGDAMFKHRTEGADDMPAHIRTVLNQSSLTIPVQNNQLMLGTWQGIFLWEHRLQNFDRKIILTFLGCG